MSDDKVRSVQSEPEYRAVVLFALLCLLTIPVVMNFSLSLRLSITVYVFVIAINCFSMRKFLWGIVISQETISVSFPFYAKGNTSFVIAELDVARLYRNPIRIFAFTDFLSLCLRDGRKIVLPRIGSKNFYSVEDAIAATGVKSRGRCGFVEIKSR